MCKECETCVHKSDFKAVECGTCIVSYYDGVQQGLPSNYKARPKTNADRIRAMTDEELAKWLVSKTFYQESAWSEPSYLNFLTKRDDTESRAVDGTLKWLQQPAEGD